MSSVAAWISSSKEVVPTVTKTRLVIFSRARRVKNLPSGWSWVLDLVVITVCAHTLRSYSKNKVFVFCLPYGFPVALPRCKYFHSILKLLILLAPHHIDNPMKLQLHIRPYPIMWDFLQDASCQVFCAISALQVKINCITPNK